MNRREKKGILIFAIFSCLVIMIGIVMKLLNQIATGKTRSIFGEKARVYFSGDIVIVLGLILLVFILGMYLWTRNDKG